MQSRVGVQRTLSEVECEGSKASESLREGAWSRHRVESRESKASESLREGAWSRHRVESGASKAPESLVKGSGLTWS